MVFFDSAFALRGETAAAATAAAEVFRNSLRFIGLSSPDRVHFHGLAARMDETIPLAKKPAGDTVYFPNIRDDVNLPEGKVLQRAFSIKATGPEGLCRTRMKTRSKGF